MVRFDGALARLEDSLGYQFKTPGLLLQALTHRSYAHPHNERLEFLGDSVLNCAVSILLYRRLPNKDEGKLSRIRSHLVRQDCLAKVGDRLSLSGLLQMGEGEHRNGGCQRPSILADAVEAVIGAILLDADFATAERVVIQLIEPVLAEVSFDDLGKDPKTRLQELLQAVRLSLPLYQVMVEGGTAHQPIFTVRCDIAELGLVADGSASSRKSAEQIAAGQVLSHIEAAGGIKAVKQQNNH